jgi:hypothetical protein
VLQFDRTGVAFAHLTLSPDAYAAEAENVASSPPAGSTLYVSFLTGQSDVMVQYEVADFRKSFEAEYETQATGANWLFAVPYKIDIPAGVGYADAALNYVVHLRLHRYAYASGARAEETVVARIQELLVGELTARILAGFGWSDLIINGRFANMDDLKTLVRELERLRVPDTSYPVFRRALTLISYDAKFDESRSTSMTVRPVMFARSLPSSVREAVQAMQPQSVGKWRTITIDGKWDIVSLPAEDAEAVSLGDFIKFHRTLATGGQALSQFGIERLETHLLTHDVSEADLATEIPVPSTSKRCQCESFLRRSSRNSLLDTCESERILPSALVVSIRNVINLFRAVSRDSIDCCDITSSLRRCELSLNRLLRHYRLLNARLQRAVQDDEPGESPAYWFNFVVKTRQDIADWCTYAERIVSQRTAGRFEEFLAQTERVVSYRGGVQKMLYLVDALLNSYARRVLEKRDEPAFMALFDPIDVVLSMRDAGFVRVPVRYLFSLPLTINHLWHEVGAYRFHVKYRLPYDTRTERRLGEYEKDVGPGRNDTVGLMLDVADTYGDAVTLIHGFGGDLRRFAISLATAQFEKGDFGLPGTPESERERYVVYLLTRLYAAVEFKTTYVQIMNDWRQWPMKFDRAQYESWEPPPDFVDKTMLAIASMLRDELLLSRRYDDIHITEPMLDRASNDIGKTFHAMHRTYLRELAFELTFQGESARPDVGDALQDILAGKIVRIDDPIMVDQLLLELQREIIETLKQRKRSEPAAVDGQFFSSISALVRASILHFYGETESAPEAAASTADLWHGIGPTGSIPDIQWG